MTFLEDDIPQHPGEPDAIRGGLQEPIRLGPILEPQESKILIPGFAAFEQSYVMLVQQRLKKASKVLG